MKFTLKKPPLVTEGIAEQGCKNGHIWYADVLYENGLWVVVFEFDGYCPHCGEPDCPYSEVISLATKPVC